MSCGLGDVMVRQLRRKVPVLPGSASEGRPEMIKDTLLYEYKNAPIPGGGYVTGLMFHPRQPDLLYARTDIGGVYRYDYGAGRWVSLMDSVSMEDLDEAFPAAIALDRDHPDRLYIASGRGDSLQGTFSISQDRGEHFVRRALPTVVHGNFGGRGTGTRMVVDPNDSNVIYYASQMGGLLRTGDRGESWEKLPLPEDYTTFVWVSEDSRTLVVGTAGYTMRVNERLRGHSLYVSYDGGVSFQELEEPEGPRVENSRMNGLVASRYDYDGKYLYVTMNMTGMGVFRVDLGYSCDFGDVTAGKVVRYRFREGKIQGWEDITPGPEGGRLFDYPVYGFGGICSCPKVPGLLVCTSLYQVKRDEECVYLSRDWGEHWELSMKGLEVGDIYFKTPYMKPCYNGNRNLLHWMSDVKINPFRPGETWINSGTGVFVTDDLLSPHPGYHDQCQGMEETVHLNVYAPVSGEVKVVAILGDLGGFAFRDLDRPCENSFDDEEGNRYITCINADLSDRDSSLAVIAARGNWTGKTKGGLIRTRDGFHTYEHLPMPYGLGDAIDRQLRRIEAPNTNPGWAAMSPEGQHIVWSLADGSRLPAGLVLASHDSGVSFERVRIFDREGREVTEGGFKAFSDRCRSDLFYGFGSRAQIYISRDGGRSFYEKMPDRVETREGERLDGFPVCDLGRIDGANRTEIRGEGGRTGVFYLALGAEGLWKLLYDPQEEKLVCRRLTCPGDSCFRVGLGVIRPGADYLTQKKAIYLCGILEGQYGFYRTLDECETFSRLNTDRQMYGAINSIDGDKRVFGRFFVATGSRGVLYGEEV